MLSIITITREIEQAKTEVTKALKRMDEKGINLETIEYYNIRVVKLGDLETKYRHLNKKQKPKQYIEELSTGGIIIT